MEFAFIADEILRGTKDANLPTEDCIPPNYSVLDGDDASPTLEALIPECNEPKVSIYVDWKRTLYFLYMK